MDGGEGLSRFVVAWFSLAAAVAAAAAAVGACSGKEQDVQRAPPTGDGSASDGSGVLTDATFDQTAEPDAAPDASGDASPDVVDSSAPVDASPDVGPGVCAPIDADLPDAVVSTTWSPLASSPIDDAGDTSWQSFDLTQLGANSGVAGGVFDGRYVYFASPSFSYAPVVLVRYDTTQPFGVAGAWSTFDTSSVRSCQNLCPEYAGTVFDGRFVYFIPDSLSTPDGLVMRFDTTGAFAPGPSWTTFDTATIPGWDGGQVGHGFAGGTFDGRYLYLAPRNTGRVVRYDTQAATGFGSASSWQTFDLTTQNPQAAGYDGAVFDGRYVYLVPSPWAGNASTPSDLVARYDTTKPLDGGWLFFDLASTNPPYVAGFLGAAFDGRYLYLDGSFVARLDTTAPFDSASSWTNFDLVGVIPGPDAGDHAARTGTAFDGRFVYFLGSNQPLLRYDTLSTFTSTCAWSALDTTAWTGFGGVAFGVYDGRFLYMGGGASVARFDTKSPAWMPPSLPIGGTFY